MVQHTDAAVEELRGDDDEVSLLIEQALPCVLTQEQLLRHIDAAVEELRDDHDEMLRTVFLYGILAIRV